MIAKLYALNIKEGRWDYNRVPAMFKEQVDIELRNYGFEVLEDGSLVPVEG